MTANIMILYIGNTINIKVTRPLHEIIFSYTSYLFRKFKPYKYYKSPIVSA